MRSLFPSVPLVALTLLILGGCSDKPAVAGESDAGTVVDAGDEPCDPNPCLNGGTCDHSTGVAVCSCADGYTGETCETNIDECAPNPCANGGTCSDGVASFTCACPAGYTGETCETNIDECAPNPCANGGTCSDGVASFTCACPAEWTGPTCEACGTPCSTRPAYFRDRFLSCYRDTSFCSRPYATCLEFCSEWMGCTGTLSIESDGVATVIGPAGMCF
jgi:hypothetical protein